MSETCPHCGCHGRAVGGAQPRFEYSCGSVVPVKGSAHHPQACEIIAELKAKLDAPLKPLEWEKDGHRKQLVADGIYGQWKAWTRDDGKASLCAHVDRRDVDGPYTDLAAAQAHAESLHQAQGREIFTKWFSKEPQ